MARKGGQKRKNKQGKSANAGQAGSGSRQASASSKPASAVASEADPNSNPTTATESASPARVAGPTQADIDLAYETFYVLWWVATVCIICGSTVFTQYYFLPETYQTIVILGVVSITTSCTLSYVVGLIFDTLTRRRFSNGFPPFGTPVALLVWWLLLLSGIALFGFFAGASQETVVNRIIYGPLAGVGWTVFMLVAGVALDFLSQREFSQNQFPFGKVNQLIGLSED